jgi:hypothetical protein
MSGMAKAVPLVVLCILIIAVPSVWAYWVQDGVGLCTATGSQTSPQITSDGSGGSIVTWNDQRAGNWDIYAQRVSASGSALWTVNGATLCTATGSQQLPQITSDGVGGAIVTWQDQRSGNWDIYVQRVNASGTAQWTTDGVALCTATGNQQSPMIASDGAGGAIVTWQDQRSGNWDIYVQRVNASGSAQWTANGVVLCGATGTQQYPMMASDSAGGAIVTWEDYRSGSNADIYAQRVNASGSAQWTTNGVALCAATGGQNSPTIGSDGVGGAIVTWYDLRSSTYHIYAQRVNALGIAQWTTDGVALCMAAGSQLAPTIVADGAGGAIVTWEDIRSLSTYDIYAQRVNASGTAQWTTNGIALCVATGNQYTPTITSDGAAGAIVTWQDGRNGTSNYDIYAQRVNATGTVQWTTDGVALCAATANQMYPTITSDGAYGAIVTWFDNRSGNNDIYAQSVDSRGRVCFFAPGISAVHDVRGDQGGWARISIDKSRLDDALELTYPISMYGVWLRIDDRSQLAQIARGNASSVSDRPAKELNGRYFVQSKEPLGAGAFPAGTWELLGKFAACQDNQYIYRGRTRADSTKSGIPYSVYIVSANTTTPSVWFLSDPDSGYSVDNLSPYTPRALTGEESSTPMGLKLTWGRDTEADLGDYHVYRGSSESFVPGSSNLIASRCDTTFFDNGWRQSSVYYYKVSAIDIHGNESGFALLTPDAVTGTETPKAPEASYLAQNYPNPFNPTTRIVYGLAASAHVSLRIYDASGRLVRVLVNEDRRAGRYEEAWNGADWAGREVGSGIYFYRLVAGRFENTRKMILLR